MTDYVIPFERLGMHDVERVGGKNASLGEMIGALSRLGVKVPGGFATSAHAYREFLAQGGLDGRIRAELAALDVDDVAQLAASGARIRQWVLATPFPAALGAAVSAQLQRMSGGRADLAVAVRSSATAEDLPEASFAGQLETFLNVRGEAAVLKALLEFERLDADLKEQIRAQMAGYADPVGFYVAKLAEGIAQIAAAFAPEPVIVRLSDFKSNEYANLIGGARYEPHEENPMLGFRGASRYVDESFRPCFELECRALKRVREDMGLSNVQVMVPFVRSLEEARQVTALLAANGLARGSAGLTVIMMCELPTNALLAEKYLDYFDGMSIGSNDMTQLTLGLDRDSAIVAKLFDERDPAVKRMLSMAISACRKRGKYVGICGQGPSDYPDLARWLLEQGIESMSLNPDTVVETWLFLAQGNAAAPAAAGGTKG